ncbi:CPBP family intramembrane glutamic endopeptidase [Metabacillus sp. 84]|uniref:CPBP family intramembrane glutamic endopeptidase n=1 Tax=Metabacillus sp. 84 TaxID=3404705 RepID=UPI003CE98796
MFKNQIDLIHSLTDRQMIQQLYMTQTVLAAAGLAGSWLFLGDVLAPAEKLSVTLPALLSGIGLAGLAVAADYAVTNKVPAGWYDDGGVNEKLFRSCSIPHIALMAAIIAFTEEWLFRGVLQNEFGLLAASLTFSILHLRYLTKPLLFAMVTAVSLLIGLLYEMTDNLFAVMTAHFLIDFIFGIQIRVKYVNRGET